MAAETFGQWLKRRRGGLGLTQAALAASIGYAAETMQESDSLVGALRKLNEKNLSNLTPHPLYSGFYYSHPTLVEREAALTR